MDLVSGLAAWNWDGRRDMFWLSGGLGPIFISQPFVLVEFVRTVVSNLKRVMLVVLGVRDFVI